jgi:hypothetical protein
LELIKKLDTTLIEQANKLNLKECTIETYSSYIIFAIQDAFLQGVNLRNAELIEAVSEEITFWNRFDVGIPNNTQFGEPDNELWVMKSSVIERLEKVLEILVGKR